MKWIIASMGLLGVFFSSGVAMPSPHPAVFSMGPIHRPMVALTFDDGPKPERILPILDILDQYQVKGTFFVVGKMAELNRDVVLRISQAGNEVANHTYTHPNLTRLDAQRVQMELAQTNDVIARITGHAPRYFRPPGGNYSDEIVSIAHEQGLATALWTINAEDFTYLNPLRDLGAPPRGNEYRHAESEIADIVIRKAKNGAIVLFHAGGPETEAALPKIITALKSKGFRMVTLSELMMGTSEYPIPDLKALK